MFVKKGNRTFVVPSKAYREYYDTAREALAKMDFPLVDTPVNISAKFYVDTKRRVDLDNLITALLDTIKGVVIPDDNQYVVRSFDKSAVYYDKNNPRTVVTISESKLPPFEDYRLIVDKQDKLYVKCEIERK